jgi:hypothetical protein
MRADLDAMARSIDAAVERGVDPFVALVDADREHRPLDCQEAVQLSLDLRG